MNETTEVLATGAPVRQFLDRHLALMGALLLVVLATMRVYFVAGFDLPTALSVLAIVDRTQLLTATVLSGVAYIVPLLFIQPRFRKWLWAGNAPGAGFTKQMRTALLWFPLSGVVIFTLSLPLLIGWFVGWLLLLVLKRQARRKARKAGRRSAGKDTHPLSPDTNNWIFASLVGLTLITVLYQPWLAREALHVANDEEVVAHVVGVQGDMTLVLELPGSAARWIKTDEIESRAVCRGVPAWYSATVSTLLPRQGEDCTAILNAKREASNSPQ
ncbi:hypothetical protein [Mycetocola zhujimingii]|uniref:Uncharacterized protein n=1 Tax=Mycetocola zhujimingii TaxID=2079792 RepID=A0A2U1TCF0_9MICO|nr:hypothetical protein [Mycetocola zhujimingii]PWC06569.1 hypothetical protein DF223_10730 [Mycetocola zhujimingii]